MTAPLGKQLSYYRSLLSAYAQYRKLNYGITNLRRCIEDYRTIIRKYLGRDLSECSAVEIGFGARPFRAAALASTGARVYGVDLERPLISISLSELRAIAKTNGLQRAAKSAFRKLILEHGERVAFEREFKTSIPALTARLELTVANAADAEFWRQLPKEIDFIYSEDVLEHIPPDDITKLCDNIRMHISQETILIFRPNIYTGITGAHTPDWFHLNVESEKHAIEPWNHLVTGEHEPTVYLNKFTESDYYNLFSRKFEIIDVNKTDFGLGRRFLTKEVRSRIPDRWTNDDLLTNNVLYIMRNRNL
jgi:hypothetical protein